MFDVLKVFWAMEQTNRQRRMNQSHRAEASEKMPKKRRHVRVQPLKMLLFLLTIIFVLSFAVNIYLRQEKEMRRLSAESDDLHKKLDLAMQEEKDIEEMKNMSGSEDFIERMARDELGLVRPEEIIFVH